MIQIHRLATDELARLAEIDVAEKVTLIYRWHEGRLAAQQRDSARPTWSVTDWAQHVADWQANLQPDVYKRQHQRRKYYSV